MRLEQYKEILNYLKEIISGSEFEDHVFSVGGCVRDSIMGNDIKDIDLVIDLVDGGLRFAEWVELNKLSVGSVVTYPTYGTAMFRLVKYPDVELECVQTRKEQYKDKNSRNPETTHGTLIEDAFRRDLTINALYWNISRSELIDTTGNGCSDIEKHIIRVTSTPDIVYSDDSLRILRCIRFFTRFNAETNDWTIDFDTMRGMRSNVDRLSIITKERIADEFNKMLLGKDPITAIKLIKDIGAMKYIIPELEETYDMTQNKYHFGTVFEHTLKVLENVVGDFTINDDNKRLTIRMAALLHDIGKIKTRTVDENGCVHFYKHELASAEMCDTILRRLKYSNEFIKDVQFLVKNHMRCKNWLDDCSRMKDKALRKLQYECGQKYYYMLLMLIDADNNAHAPEYCMPNQLYNIELRSDMMAKDGTLMLKYHLPIDGNDIMSLKKLKPCAEVKKYLDYALKIAFNLPKITKEELLKLVKNYKLK